MHPVVKRIRIAHERDAPDFWVAGDSLTAHRKALNPFNDSIDAKGKPRGGFRILGRDMR